MSKQEIQKMLQHTEQDVVYAFITTYAESNAEFYKQLKANLLPEREDDLNKAEYQTKAENCFNFEDGGRGWRSQRYDFYQAAYNAASALDRMLSDADYLIEQRKYAPAVGIIMSVAEVIPRNYESVDDSSGSLAQTFNMATETIITLLHSEQVSKRLKEEIYEWAKQEMNDSIYSDYGFDSLTNVYEAAYEELGETDEVLANLDRQIEEASNYRKEGIVLRKIQFMQARNLDTHSFIGQYLDMNAVREIRFDQLMKSELYNEALALAQKGVECTNTQDHFLGITTDWEKSILDIYIKQGDVKNILSQAKKLLYKRHYNKDEYYQIIKKHINPNDWTDTLERILHSFEDSSYFDSFAANVMVEHQMWERLLAYCKKGYDVATTIEQYEQYLKPYFEKEILDIYREYVEKEALIARSSAYDRVARMLKHMKTFDGGTDVVNHLVQEYRNTYKRRKSMMAVLKGL